MEKSVYGMLAFLLVCQIFSFVLHWTRSNRAITRAFETLEMDFENLVDHVQSQLGRISRLKRATMEKTAPTEPPEAEVSATGGFHLTPRQRQLQASILARRNRGGEGEAKPS